MASHVDHLSRQNSFLSVPGRGEETFSPLMEHLPLAATLVRLASAAGATWWTTAECLAPSHMQPAEMQRSVSLLLTSILRSLCGRQGTDANWSSAPNMPLVVQAKSCRAPLATTSTRQRCGSSQLQLILSSLVIGAAGGVAPACLPPFISSLRICPPGG